MGVSGRKDSLCLLHALVAYRRRAPFPYELTAAPIEPGKLSLCLILLVLVVLGAPVAARCGPRALPVRIPAPLAVSLQQMLHQVDHRAFLEALVHTQRITRHSCVVRGTPGGATCDSRPRVSTISVAHVQEYLSRWYRWWTVTVLTLVAVAVLAGGLSFYVRVTSRGTDFNVFYLGGRLVTEAPEELYKQASNGE